MKCLACPDRAVQLHHVIYRQELRMRAREWRARGGDRKTVEMTLKSLVDDERNLVPVCKRCHERHHQRVRVLPVTLLPDSVFVFAEWLMGPGPAYEYLRRHYCGRDPRSEEWLREAAA